MAVIFFRGKALHRSLFIAERIESRKKTKAFNSYLAEKIMLLQLNDYLILGNYSLTDNKLPLCLSMMVFREDRRASKWDKHNGLLERSSRNDM